MRPSHRIAKNTAILYARMAITVFISLYSTRLVLQALGEEDYGILNVVGGAIAMLMFLNNAMTTATQRFMSYSQGADDLLRQKQIFNVSVLLHLIIAVMIFFLLQGGGYILFHGVLNISAERMEAAQLIYQFMIFSTFFAVVSVPYDAVINAHENMFLVAVLGIMEAVIRLGIAIYVLNSPYDKLVVYGLLMAILTVFSLLLRQLYCRRYYAEAQIKVRKYYNKDLFKEMTSFAGWSFLGATTSMFGYYGQGIVLNMFFGTRINAAQGVAALISGQLGTFATTMQKALNPVIAKSEGAGDRAMMLRASMFGSKISFFLLIIFYIPMIIEMPYIFRLWLKDVPEFAIIFCRLLLARNLVEQLYSTLSNAIAAVGNIKQFQIYSSILFVLPLFVSYLMFVFGYPPYMLYVVFLVFSFMNFGVTVYFAYKNCDLSLHYYFKIIVFRCLMAFGIIFSISSVPVFFMQPGLVRIVVAGVISLIAFFVTVWHVGFTHEEQVQVRKLFNGLIDRVKVFFPVPHKVAKQEQP